MQELTLSLVLKNVCILYDPLGIANEVKRQSLSLVCHPSAGADERWRYMEAGRWPDQWADWVKAEGPRAVLESWQQEVLRLWHPPWSGSAMLDLLATMEPELSRQNDRLSELTASYLDHWEWQQAWET